MHGVDRARLLATSTKESGAWLQVLRISALGLQLDNDSLRIAIGLIQQDLILSIVLNLHNNTINQLTILIYSRV